MPLARVGARTDSRGQFPRTRIDIVRDSTQYALRVLHFSVFHS